MLINLENIYQVQLLLRQINFLKMNESSYSACNRDLINNKEDLSILLDKLPLEKNIKNDDKVLVKIK